MEKLNAGNGEEPNKLNKVGYEMEVRGGQPRQNVDVELNLRCRFLLVIVRQVRTFQQKRTIKFAITLYSPSRKSNCLQALFCTLSLTGRDSRLLMRTLKEPSLLLIIQAFLPTITMGE